MNNKELLLYVFNKIMNSITPIEFYHFRAVDQHTSVIDRSVLLNIYDRLNDSKLMVNSRKEGMIPTNLAKIIHKYPLTADQFYQLCLNLQRFYYG